MSLLDVSIVNVALPSIRDGAARLVGVTCSGSCRGTRSTFGLVLVPAGRLGDVRGRRTMFLTGLILFIVASAACGFATGSLMLIVARLLQGVGRRHPEPAGVRVHPGALPRQGAGQRLRPAGRDDRAVDRGRPARRRPADPAVRGVVGLAVGLLRQPADRDRCRRARAAMAARQAGRAPGGEPRPRRGGPARGRRPARAAAARAGAHLDGVDEVAARPGRRWRCSRSSSAGSAATNAAASEPMVDLELFRTESYAFGSAHRPRVLRGVHRHLLRPHALPADRPGTTARCRRASP